MNHALLCTKIGSPPLLEWREIEDAGLEIDEVRIDVRAVGVNHADVLTLRGDYQTSMRTPFIPGIELSGVVVQTGRFVDTVSVGDLVVAQVTAGAYQQQIVIDAAMVRKIPDGADPAQAAAFPISYCTALYALEHVARAKAGQTVLILGANGNIGRAAIEVAKLLGLNVIAASSGPRLAKEPDPLLVRHLELDKVDLRKSVDEITRHAGVHVILDPVGGETTVDALRCCAWDGHHLVVGFASGTIPDIPANLLLLQGRHMSGVNWHSLGPTNPELWFSVFDRAVQLFADGRLPIAPTREYAMAEVPDRITEVFSERSGKKIILLS